MKNQFNAAASVKRFSGFIFACVLVVGCASSPIKTGADFNQAANFSQYRHFAWLADDPMPVIPDSEPISPLTIHRIKSSIEETLIQKGYEMADRSDGADFVISFVVGTRDKISATSYPRGWYSGRRGGWVWCGPYCYDDEVIVRTYTEGTLSVDVFDAASREPVWHGWAKKTITQSDRDNPREIIKQAVEQLLGPFPSA